MNNYAAGVKFEAKAAKATGKETLLNSALVFDMFSWFFGMLSVWATYTTLKEVTSPLDYDPIIMMAVIFGVAVIWDIFKYFSIEWVFADQVISTRFAAVVVTFILIFGSFYFHVYGASLRNSNMSTEKVEQEVNYQRETNTQRLEIQKKLLDSNKGLESVLNNGTASDDAGTVGTMELNLKLIEKLQDEKSEAVDGEKLMEIYASNIETKTDMLMITQIVIEMFLAFTILSKFIFVANRDDRHKDYQEAINELMGLLGQARTDKTVESIKDKIKELKEYQSQKNKIGITYIAGGIEKFKEMLKQAETAEDINSREPTENKGLAVQEGQSLMNMLNNLSPEEKESLMASLRNSKIDEPEEVEQEKPKVISNEKPRDFLANLPIPVEAKEKLNDFIADVEISNTKVRALDPSFFIKKDWVLATKILFEQGETKIGEQLLTQAELMRILTKRDVKSVQSLANQLYDHLRTYGYIEKRDGEHFYRAKSELPKKIWTEQE